MRRPRNIAIKLVLLLLLGAIVNVAVAWGCAASVSSSGRAEDNFAVIRTSRQVDWLIEVDAAYGFGYSRLDVLWALSRRDTHPKDFDGPTYSIRESDKRPTRSIPVRSLPRWSRLACYFPGPRGGCEIDSEEGCGWPLVCLRRILWPYELISISEIELGGFHLPADVYWPGFAINTIFYAAVLWLLFAAPGMVKRRIRRRRGRCLHCGYDLRGQPADSNKCPECGRGTIDRHEM